MDPRTVLRPREMPDFLLARTRQWTTVSETARLCGTSDDNARRALSRLVAANKLATPARGFYAVVPPPYRHSDELPPFEFWLDGLFEHLGQPYHVAALGAAVFHQASHFSIGRFDVRTRPRTQMNLPFIDLRYDRFAGTELAPTQLSATSTGYLEIATKELVVVELVSEPARYAGIPVVISVIARLDPLDPEILAKLAAARGQASVARAGLLLERFRPDVDLSALRSVQEKPKTRILLNPKAPPSGDHDDSWRININAPLEDASWDPLQ